MEKLAILDCGGQYTKVIDRKVRELGVYSDIFPMGVGADKLIGYDATAEVLTAAQLTGVKNLVLLIPGLFFALATLVAVLHPLSERKIAQTLHGKIHPVERIERAEDCRGVRTAPRHARADRHSLFYADVRAAQRIVHGVKENARCAHGQISLVPRQPRERAPRLDPSVAAEGYLNIVPQRNAAHDHGEIVVAVCAFGADVERVVQLCIALFMDRHKSAPHFFSAFYRIYFSDATFPVFSRFFTFCSHTVFHI